MAKPVLRIAACDAGLGGAALARVAALALLAAACAAAQATSELVAAGVCAVPAHV